VKDWLVEIIDQVALGEFLSRSQLSCGSRFGLISLDNAVEFMLIAYVEVHRQLVGGHKPGGIPKKDWETTKGAFPKLLSFVVSCEASLGSLESEINRYHDLRNNLYHSGAPTTTAPTRVQKYVSVARHILNLLFAIVFSDDEWSAVLDSVRGALSGAVVAAGVRRSVAFADVSGIVTFSCVDTPNAREAIALLLHGYGKLAATEPDRKQLGVSLAKSGMPLAMPVIHARIADLRSSGWIRKDRLVLTAKGRKALQSRYLY
jgi:hypothetical protein